MSEITNMMFTGILCVGCGKSLDCPECASMGVPMYCSEQCAKDRGLDADGIKYRVCPNVHNNIIKCSKCNCTIKKGESSYDENSNVLCYKCNNIKK